MATNSRYDFMKEGSVIDEVSENTWPDPLSINYHEFKMSSLPLEDVMTNPKIMFFWQEAEAAYGQACWDDIVLTLNGVPHKNFLKSGTKVYFPSVDDIVTSFTKSR